MKILDATTVIAISNEINCPELIGKIALLGHDLAIPSHVVEGELLDKNTRKITEKYVQRDTIQILKKNTVKEIREFQKDFPGLGLGECDSMLAYLILQDTGIVKPMATEPKNAQVSLSHTLKTCFFYILLVKNVKEHATLG